MYVGLWTVEVNKVNDVEISGLNVFIYVSKSLGS
jgi:hypothetical protein